ncbi:MAG TPA: hypothetical protein VNL92_05440 [Dehalococcoidia bacterium]|nr:hypothetical protein [Dehalococcoidia bacterium]
MTSQPQRHLLVLRGRAGARQRELAMWLASELPGPTAVIPQDAFHTRWVLKPGPDRARESEMGARIGKLVAISYMREGYSVVVEGAYAPEDPGQESGLSELISIARTLPARTYVIELRESRYESQAPSAVASAIRADDVVDLTDEPIGSAAARIVAQLLRVTP